ncbi:tyrosine-type recombinase/integrase [Halorubrum sp. Boch-26]|uniref:tyrosine-type recombinase/integrase n=1 Tax=Halorubrum sp. Boch-26 TaxID=2994426 RepID=UPI0024696913|nr:tyrosine-type recombinase/integrase [Halorubrum sp. Boch-26]
MSSGKYDILLEADEWERRVFENKHKCINDWLRSKDSTNKSGSRRTLNSYSRTAARFFHEFFPEVHPSDVTVGDIEEYVLDLNDRDAKQNTKRRYIESLSAFYTWAMKRPRFEDITGNPAAVVLEEIPKKKRPRPETATWENGREIIRNIPDPRDKAAAILMAKTGARVREVLTVKESDLMLEQGFIRLSDRKGGHETVNPLDDESIQAIQRLQALSSDESEYLFTAIHGSRVKRERIRREIRRAAVKAGVMEDEDEDRWHMKFTPHYYRTIFTSQMRNNGMPDHYTRYLRGDGDREVMDLYTRIPRDQVRDEYLDIIKSLNLYARTDGGENQQSESTDSKPRKVRQTKL